MGTVGKAGVLSAHRVGEDSTSRGMMFKKDRLSNFFRLMPIDDRKLIKLSLCDHNV